MNKKLTKHFTINEVTNSDSAERYGIDNTPNESQLHNIKETLENVIEPLREYLEIPIMISSGFRCEKLNKKIRGARTSQHIALKGAAVDIYIDDDLFTNEDMFNYIRENLEFDQVIAEFWNNKNEDYYWIHVSFNKGNNRKQALIASKVEGRTVYTKA